MAWLPLLPLRPACCCPHPRINAHFVSPPNPQVKYQHIILDFAYFKSSEYYDNKLESPVGFSPLSRVLASCMGPPPLSNTKIPSLYRQLTSAESCTILHK